MPQTQTYNPMDRAIRRVDFKQETDPAAAANLTIVPISYHRSAMLLLSCKFVADGNVIDRTISLGITSGGNLMMLGITDSAITAGQTIYITFSVGIAPSEPLAKVYRFVPITGDVWIPSSDRFVVQVANMQAADQISDIFTQVEHLHGF